MLHRNRITHVLIICLVLILVSCSYNNKRKSTHRQREVASVIDVTNTTSDSEYVNTKSIDFFGVKMQGKYEDIVRKIYKLPMLSLLELREPIAEESSDVMYVFHGVEFCGVPCGMNVRFRKHQSDEISIHSLIFITSQTDDEIIHNFVSELTKYYGEPYRSDDKEDRYDWYRGPMAYP